MTILTSQTPFAILAAPEVFSETEDIYLFPENSGSLAVRELRYPGDVLPPLQYESNPDRWENFDSAPMSGRPQVKVEPTLGGNQIAVWNGYDADRPIREVWRGADKTSRMSAYFLRRLYEYLANTPATGTYITWTPKDRTEQDYYVQLESLTVGGQEISMDFLAIYQAEKIMGEVVLQFRILGEAS